MKRSLFLALSAALSRVFASGQTAEASASLDAGDLPAVLSAIVPLIERGFASAQVAELVQLAKSMKIDEERDRTFSIAYKGQSARLRVVLHCDDTDNFELFFFTHPDLAQQIHERIRRVMEQLGRKAAGPRLATCTVALLSLTALVDHGSGL